MRKILVIARRDYLAAVRTKAFIIGLVMLPVLMAGMIGLQVLLQKMADVDDKRIAVIDRTPGGKLFQTLEKAAAARNANDIFDPATHQQIKPAFLLVNVDPSANTAAARQRQRYYLSQQVLRGEYHAVLEIGEDVYTYSRGPPPASDQTPDSRRLRYQAKNPQYSEFSRWAEKVINETIQEQRWRVARLDQATVLAMLRPAPLVAKGLSRRDPDSGAILDAPTESQRAHFLVPAALVFEMFLMLMVGASPLVGSVLEEKLGRIAEVLLGSVSPFQLMMGKLLGMVGVTLTIVAVYLAGTFWAAQEYGVAERLTLDLIVWFLVFLVLAVLLYGAMCIAIGAACTTGAQTQVMLTPVIMLAVLPILVLVPVIEQPNGAFATACSFFPPATPLLMVARLAVPPGVPWWQPPLGMVLMLLATALCTYAAGRIVRVGILMVGRGPNLRDLVRWVFRG
jgi:ABC-2 type transport system permease protein